MIERLALLAVIGLLLVGFGAVLVWPEVGLESRAAAAVAVLGGLLLVSRTARRRDD